MKKLRETYVLRPETMVSLMMDGLVMGYIIAIIQNDDDPIFFSDEKNNIAAVKEFCKKIKDLKRLKDGTFHKVKHRATARE